MPRRIGARYRQERIAWALELDLRPYKEPFPREKCFAILEEGRGTHFDARVLDVFFERIEEIINIQLQYMDVE